MKTLFVFTEFAKEKTFLNNSHYVTAVLPVENAT